MVEQERGRRRGKREKEKKRRPKIYLYLLAKEEKNRDIEAVNGRIVENRKNYNIIAGRSCRGNRRRRLINGDGQ